MAQGIEVKVSPDGKTATVKIDLTGNLGPSSSKKTVIVAKTGKAIQAGEAYLGITAYRYPTDAEKAALKAAQAEEN